MAASRARYEADSNLVCYQNPSGRCAWAFSRLGLTPESAQDTFLRVENGLDISVGVRLIDDDVLSNSDDVKAASWRGRSRSADSETSGVLWSWIPEKKNGAGGRLGLTLVLTSTDCRLSPAKLLLLKRLIRSRYLDDPTQPLPVLR
jgi:hypothetical protein